MKAQILSYLKHLAPILIVFSIVHLLNRRISISVYESQRKNISQSRYWGLSEQLEILVSFLSYMVLCEVYRFLSF